LIQNHFYGFFIKAEFDRDLLAFERFSALFVNIPIQKVLTFYNFLPFFSIFTTLILLIYSGKYSVSSHTPILS